jgi:hypothetical protein
MIEKLKRGFLMLLKAEAIFYAIVLGLTGIVWIIQAIF